MRESEKQTKQTQTHFALVGTGEGQKNKTCDSIAYEEIQDRIIFRLINYRRNQTLLQELPHQRQFDFAVVFCYLFPKWEDGKQTTSLIRTESLEKFGISAEELAAKAYENTERLQVWQSRNLENVLSEFVEEHRKKTQVHQNSEIGQMFRKAVILTNEDVIHGAAAILYPGLLARLAKESGTDFVILPSSIHETILLPLSRATAWETLNDCSEIVREINRTILIEQEILSDYAYFYDHTEDRFYSNEISEEGSLLENRVLPEEEEELGNGR